MLDPPDDVLEPDVEAGCESVHDAVVTVRHEEVWS